MQHWIVIDEKYLNYLRAFESRIPHSDYGADKYKPFFGELFSVGDLVYVTHISHAKPQHQTMKNSPIFQKIYLNDSQTGQPDRLAAVIKLNYMFPLPKTLSCKLEYKDLDQHRNFSSEREKNIYIDLLKKEIAAINTMNIDIKAKKLYDLKNQYPENYAAQKCLEFIELEKLALTYPL